MYITAITEMFCCDTDVGKLISINTWQYIIHGLNAPYSHPWRYVMGYDQVRTPSLQLNLWVREGEQLYRRRRRRRRRGRNTDRVLGEL